MRKSLQVLGCLAALAAPLIVLPAHAAPSDEMSRAHSAWTTQHHEMEMMRSEREKVEDARDRLRMQCMDAKGQDRVACDAQIQALNDRMKNMHEKREAMHEKHDKQRAERHEHKKDWSMHKAEHRKKHMKSGKVPTSSPSSDTESGSSGD